MDIEGFRMSWEDIIKMKCMMCGAKLEKQPSKTKYARNRAIYLCPECGHKEVF